MKIMTSESEAGPTASYPASPVPWLARVLHILRSDVTAELSMADVASSVSISKSLLFRAFRRSVGQTPHQWRLTARIAAAQVDLVERPCGIAEIAHRYGFSDQAHFARTFKQNVGETPTTWLARETLRS